MGIANQATFRMKLALFLLMVAKLEQKERRLSPASLIGVKGLCSGLGPLGKRIIGVPQLESTKSTK
jgi:hypothetical protein